MKKFAVFALVSVLWFAGYSQQYPVSQYLGATNTLVITRGGLKVDSAFILPAFGDTAYANISPYIKNYPGTLIRVLDVIYMRNYNATQWIAIQGGGGGGNPWNLTGNANATAGSSFLGTTNSIPLEFKVNNRRSGYLDSTYKTTAFGFGALRDVTPAGTTTGNHNVGIGYKAINKDTTGYQNTALGSQSMLNSSGSIGNVSLGYGAMGLSRKVNYNVAMGWGALSKNYYGYYNTAIGHNSAGNLVPVAGDTLIYNTFLGAFSGYNQRAGRNNVMIGDSAGLNNQSGSRNVFIGSNAGANETGSDKLYIANTGTTSPLIKGDFVTEKISINGKVLVGGTQTPDSTMDVKGGMRLQSLYSSNDASDSMLVVKSNGGVGIRTTPANYWTKIADTIYNNNAGYVGIGTTSPDFKLDVNGIIGTNNGVNIAANGAKTGFYSNGNRLDIWAGNNKIADIGLASANQNLYNFNYSIQPGTGATGNQNSLNLSSSVVAGGLGTNSVNVSQLDIAPTYNQAPSSGALGTGTLRGVYYHPTVSALNTSTHYAIETTSGQLKFGNTPTSSDSTTYKPMGMNSSGDVVRMNNWITGGGGGGSGTVTSVATGYGLSGGTITTSGTLLVDTATLSTKYVRVSDNDTIYTTSPIMTTVSNDSTIVYFNADTANAWRGNGTVKSVATGYGLSGGTITSTGTLLVDTATLSTKYVRISDTASALSKYVPYIGATQDVDLGTNKISSQSVYVTGTNGNGHIHLKHQASDATATGQSTSLFADSNGDIKWKNDGNYYTTLKTSGNGANAVYTYPSATTTLIGASDTATMLSTYARTNVVNANLATKLNITDTATMLSPYVRSNAISSGYLSSDVTTTNLTATNTNLTFSIAANETWRIMIAGTAKNSTTGQVKIAIGAPTGCTMRGVVTGGGATMGSSTVNQALNAINTLSAGFATGNNVEVAFRFEGVVVNGANAGSITLQFAAGTTGTATIYNGTLMQWTRTKPL